MNGTSFLKLNRSYVNRHRLVVAVSLLLLSSSGCGYQLQGGGTILPEGVRKIYVSRVVNRSSETTLSQLLTEALRDEFERYGAVDVVDSARQSDAELVVEVTQVRRGTRASTSVTDTALQQDTTVTASGTLKSRDGQVLWQDPALVVTRPFGVSANSVITSSAAFAGGNLGSQDISGLSTREVSRGQEQQALDDIATQVARRIYTDAVAPDF